MQIILLSGGSGKRLWPLSNNTRSKQFIKLLTAPDGSKESMVQRVVRQLREAGICDSITVATSQSQWGCHHQPAWRRDSCSYGTGTPQYIPGYRSRKLVFSIRT